MDPNKPKSPNLLAALQNPYLKTVSYTLPDGTIIIDPRKPVTPELSKVGICTVFSINATLFDIFENQASKNENIRT